MELWPPLKAMALNRKKERKWVREKEKSAKFWDPHTPAPPPFGPPLFLGSSPYLTHFFMFLIFLFVCIFLFCFCFVSFVQFFSFFFHKMFSLFPFFHFCHSNCGGRANPNPKLVSSLGRWEREENYPSP